MSLWIRCREATELASRALDERLPLSRRIALRLHRTICRNCARFIAQLDQMRRLLRFAQTADEDDARLSPEARRRIAKELQSTRD